LSAVRFLTRKSDPIFRSTRQAGLCHFQHLLGSVAYTQARGVKLTLGPPSCAPEVQAVVAHAFLKAHPDAAFFYVTRAQLDAMELPTQTTLPIGTDTVLPLPLRSVPDLARTALRKATKAGLTLDEPSDLKPLSSELRTVQAGYLSTRAVKTELQFLNRPCEFERETDARTFVLRQRGVMIGFVVLDAYVTAAGGRGFLLNMFRLAPTKLWNVYQAVVLMLAEALAAEGVSELSLGFVPLAETGEAMPWNVRVQHAVLKWVASRSSYLQRLGVIKHGFESKPVTRFLSTPRRLVLRDVQAFIAAMAPSRDEGAQTRMSMISLPSKVKSLAG
jgi:lysylphosphatidylglycerol synthetase-like protein (DUF2156 family)